MSSAGQQATREEAFLASRASNLPQEAAPEYPQAPYYRARYYDPTAGRFGGEDPLQFRFGMNLYLFEYNSPTNLIDPSGEAPIDYILPNWLVSAVNWNYVPAICSIDSFRFYGAGTGSDNIKGGVYKLDNVHYTNTSSKGWHVDGMEGDKLVEGSGSNWGGGVVLGDGGVREGLLFPPSPYHGKAQIPLGPVKLRAEGGLGSLIGVSKDGVSIGFYGDVGFGAGIGKFGGGFGGGGGWSLNITSATSCSCR